MEERRSRSAASDNAGRVRVLSHWALLGVTAAVVGTLYLLFPHQALVDKVLQVDQANEGDHGAANDELTADYIAALLRTEPANFELRMLLAEKRHALGQLDLAREAMEPVMLSGDAGLRRRALLLELQLVQAAMTGADDSKRAELQAQLRLRLAQYQEEDWSARQLMVFWRTARRLQLADVAAVYEKKLLARQVPTQWLEEMAQQLLADGAYAESARMYFAAQQNADDLDERRDYFLKGVTTLRSGNLLREAMAAADAHIGDLQDDEQTLAYLTRLALAAGDPKRAQVYVKRMLHLSQAPAALHGALQQAALALLDTLVPSARAAEVSIAAPAAPSPSPSPGLRPYDEELYTLAFNVFLANGNVADAYRVAAAAVAQRPADMVWQRRLAQTAEWSGRPQEALAQWRQIAERGGAGAEEAWQSVLRLAPGLQDYEALLAAWRREAARRRLSADEWKRVAELYELLGQPAEGIAWLKGEYEKRRELVILDIAASLEERSGRAADAITSLDRIMQLGGADAPHALRLATLLFLRSDFERAYAVLEPMRERARPEDQAYWKLLADLAWQLQNDAAASEAYGRLQAAGSAENIDLERLVSLLRAEHPEEARRMALFAWRRYHGAWAMLIALELANQQRDTAGTKALLAEIRPEDEARLGAFPYYFVLRANYFQASGDRDRARAEYRRALAANPDNSDLRLSYLWLLIDGREAPELRKRLAEWGGSDLPAWWDAYAAGWLALKEPRRALPWMTRQAAAHADDFLWLANYAETLEEAGQTGFAERVRQHAWLQARQRMRDDPGLADRRDAMLGYARLALRRAPGDVSLNVMRRLLREDASRPETAGDTGQPAPVAAMDNAVRELVLAWTLGEERIEAAREWMWTRYARRVDAPAWADISLALVEHDRERLAEILEDTQRDYPAAARIDAARELGRRLQAATLGFEAQQRTPDDEDIHLRLANDLLAGASSVIARDIAFQRGVLQGHEESLRAESWVLPQLRLAVDLGVMHQHSGDGAQLAGVPSTDRTLGFSALWQHERGETELSAAARESMASFNSLKLTHTRPLDERLSGSAALSLRERAGESVALGIAGHKDEASASLNYRLSGREYLVGRIWEARFHTQQDAYLGNGRGLSVEAGYRVRSEYPDLNVRLSRVISHFEAEGGSITDSATALLPGSPASAPASFLMPQSFRLWGVNAGFGTDFRERRSRALRPFADIGRSVSSASGSGYNWLLGAGGSVLGPDHLAAYWMRSKGGGLGSAVRELGLRYQMYFD